MNKLSGEEEGKAVPVSVSQYLNEIQCTIILHEIILYEIEIRPAKQLKKKYCPRVSIFYRNIVYSVHVLIIHFGAELRYGL